MRWVLFFMLLLLSCSKQEIAIEDKKEVNPDCGLMLVKGDNWFLVSKVSSDMVATQKTNLKVATRREKCSNIKSDLVFGMTFSW